MNITETILKDHAARKGEQGVTWFKAEDLTRLGLPDALFTVFQNVQHALKSKRLPFVAESAGHIDGWSVRDLKG